MQWDEVWCINSAISVFDCDRAFILDPMERFLDSDDAGAQTDVMRRVLPTFDKPIYSCGLDERVPAVVEYPLHEVMQEFKTAYFNTTVAFTVAFALWSEVDQIDLLALISLTETTCTLLKLAGLVLSSGYPSASVQASK